jgi:hypothetical protein
MMMTDDVRYIDYVSYWDYSMFVTSNEVRFFVDLSVPYGIIYFFVTIGFSWSPIQ